ncbi:TPA: hypothetical protein ACUUBM_004583, partial [Pseudomonas aeruginosa]
YGITSWAFVRKPSTEVFVGFLTKNLDRFHGIPLFSDGKKPCLAPCGAFSPVRGEIRANVK